MKKCAFLSMDSLQEFDCYDHLLFEPLADRGWSVEEISWRNTQVDWNQFEAVVVRSPWDYQKDPEAFFKVLREIDQSSARLENKLELMKWNIDKTYLRDLEENGIEIVPSIWEKTFSEERYKQFFDEFSSDEVIIKPTISAGAEDTFRIQQQERDQYTDQLASLFDQRPFIVQPFMPFIIEEGEFSLFYFGDTYSHTVLKTPEQNDFRVQEEHGGRLQKVEPETQLQALGKKIFNQLEPQPLYTRVDVVRTAQNTFALMELELIEPSLYFNMDPASPERFARVFDDWMQGNR
jgi:glutathione synthase/RimK-type ligase-like ATP-grasp enzyme